MIRTILTASALALGGCMGMGDTAPPVHTASDAGCEAMRPAMPIAYHGKGDTPDTITRIRDANARFKAGCP